MGLIEDIRPAYQRGYGKHARKVSRIKTEILVSELYNRGVNITDIFGMYYAMEEMAGHRDDEIFGSSEEGQHGKAVPKLTVGDAQLAGDISPRPGVRQPF